jgi:hypothetical protein
MTSTCVAPPCSAYLTTEHDTLGFADFDLEGAVGSGSLVVMVEQHVRDDVLALTWAWDGVLGRWGVGVLVPGRGKGWR